MSIDIIMAIMTAVSILISVIALVISYCAAQKGNALAKTANDLTRMANAMQQGQVEMQIREMISAARRRFEDVSLKLKACKNEDVAESVIESALEDFLNTYDEACAKYIDAKVDKERFKKLYYDEIRQLVDNEATKEKYQMPQTKYRATVKVYDEWNNLER